MTITSTVRKAGPYPGNGVTTGFPFDFKVFKKEDVTVTFTDANGADSVLVLDSDYSVLLNEDQDNNPGGTITYPRVGSLLPILDESEKLTATGGLAYTQPTDIPNLSPFFPQVVEDALDRAEIQIQQIKEITDRSIKIGVSDATLTPLPPAAGRGNTVLGFDALGNVTVLPIPSAIGAGDRIPFTLKVGVDFNPGDTQVNLPRAPGAKGNLEINFDGFGQEFGEWDVNGVVVTFTSPIPAGVTEIWGYIGTTLSTIVPPVGSVGSAQIVPHSVGDGQLAWGNTLGRVVDSVAALKLLDTTIYRRAFAMDFYGVGGAGGGGPYWFDPASADAEIPGVIVAPAVGTGRWKLVFNGRLMPEQCGAKGDGATADIAAFNAAHTALPIGGELLLSARTYMLEGWRVDKPITIRGTNPGSVTAGITVGTSEIGGSRLKCLTAAGTCIIFVARQGNYAFGAYGVLGIRMENVCIEGKAIDNHSVAGIATDTTVNGGDYHVRHIDLSNVTFRFFGQGINFTGIAYLNTFVQCKFYWCDYGFWQRKGSASDYGGQTRFTDCTFDLCGVAASLHEDEEGGGFSFKQCSLSESQFGIRTNGQCDIELDACELETLRTGSGTGAGLYVKIAGANPSTSTVRNVTNCRTLNSENDIWIDKTTASSIDGNFHFPMQIKGNNMLSTTAVRISVPNGHQPLACEEFVIAADNGGLNNGALAASQLVGCSMIRNEMKRRITKRFTFDGSFVSGTVLWTLPLGFSVVGARMYLSANASGSTALQLGDQTLANRYLSVNAQTQPLNAWVEFARTPEVLIIPNLNSLRLVATGGMLGAAGVIEFDGYIT